MVREIVNGEMMRNFVGKEVSLTGFVKKLSPNGLSFEMKTVDEIDVKVNLQRPYNGLLEGIVEVHGTPTNNGQAINCTNFVNFDKKYESTFNASAHNTLCTFLRATPRFYNLS